MNYIVELYNNNIDDNIFHFHFFDNCISNNQWFVFTTDGHTIEFFITSNIDMQPIRPDNTEWKCLFFIF